MADRPIRILHVDDDSAVREVTAALLARVGYEVESATDGQDACDKIALCSSPYDLVITDYLMPRQSGLELAKLLRERDFPGRIIVFSASLGESDIAEFLEIGVDAVVHKGTSVSTLLTAVRNAIAP